MAGQTARRHYRVSGYAEGLGWIEKYTQAYSPKQAIKQVAEDLKKRYNTFKIFIKDSLAEEVPAPQRVYSADVGKNKGTVKQSSEQLSLFVLPPDSEKMGSTLFFYDKHNGNSKK